MTALIVEACGPGTTIQDLGRFGWQRYGLGPAGAMDRVAAAEANLLVGNTPDAAVIEFALAGGRLRVVDGVVRIAHAGAAQAVSIDGARLPPLTSATVHPGQKIEIGSAKTGQFGYLAVSGGLGTPMQLGSRALHMKAKIGGIDGRAVQAGDRLDIATADVDFSTPDRFAGTAIERGDGPIRVLLGPQDDYFTAEGLATFLGQAYTITPNADRQGIRLTGPKIAHNAKGYNIVSDGIATGTIQVPGSGEPLILLADRQTTGGYPKIATVITADLPRLGQCRPGDVIRFASVSRDAAVAALREQHQALAAFAASLRPIGAGSLDSATLLGLNLIDGWVSAAMD